MKRYDFPVMNRFGQKGTPGDFKNYMKATKALKNSYERFSNFHLLLYLADTLDVETAANIAKCVSEERPIDSHIIEWLE